MLFLATFLLIKSAKKYEDKIIQKEKKECL